MYEKFVKFSISILILKFLTFLFFPKVKYFKFFFVQFEAVVTAHSQSDISDETEIQILLKNDFFFFGIFFRVFNKWFLLFNACPLTARKSTLKEILLNCFHEKQYFLIIEQSQPSVRPQGSFKCYTLDQTFSENNSQILKSSLDLWKSSWSLWKKLSRL